MAVPTIPGKTYTLEYDQTKIGSTAGNATLEVSVNYIDYDADTVIFFVHAGTSASKPGVQVHNTFTFVALTTSVDLTFRDATSTLYRVDPGLDNVSLTTPNTALIALSDRYSTDFGTELSIAASGVLGNDTDTDGDPLTAVKINDPANGVVALNSDGSFTYTPNAGFSGQDTFTYRANDGLVHSDATSVTIEVIPPAVNNAPVAVADSYSTDFGMELTIPAPGLLANDIDADGNPLKAIQVSVTVNGALALNSDGSFIYTPDPGFVRPDSFTYNATDGKINSDDATVTIDVLPPANDSNLVGHWKFDEASGTLAADSSGWTPANNGTLSGGAAFTTSTAPVTKFINPGALSVSGATASLVSVPNSTINKLTNNFTVMG